MFMIIVNTLNRKRILSNQSEKKKTYKNNQKIKQEIHTKKKQLKNIQKNLQYIK